MRSSLTKNRQIMPRKPQVNLSGIDPKLADVLRPIKTTLDMLTGAVSIDKEIKGLHADATNAQIVEKLNEIIRRLNASGGDHVKTL